MAEKKCTGDCIKCSFQQQIYCAAQHGHAILASIPAIIERLDRLESSLPAFAADKIINPLAQEDAGAENRALEQN